MTIAYSTKLAFGLNGTGYPSVTYFMQAWDTLNLQYCFWTAINPAAIPTTTLPASLPTNLVQQAIVHKIE